MGKFKILFFNYSIHLQKCYKKERKLLYIKMYTIHGIKSLFLQV